MYKLSNNSKENRKNVDPRLIVISDLAIQISSVDFGHPKLSGLRSAEEQNLLYEEGKSNCDGYSKLSSHQSGSALDFYAYVDGKASWKEPHLAMVAAAFLQAGATLGYKIEWGGFWQSKNDKTVDGISYGWDMPHIQLME